MTDDDDDAEPPLRFGNERKIRKQMRKRGWTDQMLREAMATTPVPGVGKLHAAHRFVHPTTGRSILVDAVTGEIFHVGDEEYGYD